MALCGTGAEASWLKVTWEASCSMPSRIVCPGIWVVDPPCQV